MNHTPCNCLMLKLFLGDFLIILDPMKSGLFCFERVGNAIKNVDVYSVVIY